MASQDHIRKPIEWGWDQITLATLTLGSLGRSLSGSEESRMLRCRRLPESRSRTSGTPWSEVSTIWGLSDRRYLPLPHLPARWHIVGIANIRLRNSAAAVSARGRFAFVARTRR